MKSSGIDANEPFPVICPASPCPANYPVQFPAPASPGTPVPAGTYYCADGDQAQPLARQYLDLFLGGDSSTTPSVGREPSLQQRALLCAACTRGPRLSTTAIRLNATTSGNEPALASNPFNLRADWGLANFDVRNAAAISGLYELPFGHGKPFLHDATGVGNWLASGWTINSIRHPAGRFPVHAAAQLQPLQHRRHAESRASVS